MSGEIEIQILACPPVSPAARMQLGMSNFRASPGAVEWECERCRQSVWLGLKGQERKQANPGSLLMVEYDGGKVWFVVGYLEHPEQVDLPTANYDERRKP